MENIGKGFISHSSADKLFVDKLVSDLAKHSISVWSDKYPYFALDNTIEIITSSFNRFSMKKGCCHTKESITVRH
jgi:hypothetical protein